MAGTHITPEQKRKALTLRAAGYTHTVIADETGMSVSSIKRLLIETSVKKGGIKKAMVEKATSELINDATIVARIKHEATNLLLDDIATVKKLRLAMALATEQLEANDTASALQVMRAISAGAVALKSTSETLRKSLGLDSDDVTVDDLPELTITVLTGAEIDKIKADVSARADGLDGGLGIALPENDVVVEGDNVDSVVIAA